MTHPSTTTWALPPEREPLGGGLARTNLRALAARDGRFDHHLIVVGRVGVAQLEIATASEPLSFAHRNVSDEYVVALRTGDALVDGFPFRVFLSDLESGDDVARINHRAGDLILHPDGYAHWPGRLRPPYALPPMPIGRRAALSFVVCASEETRAGDRATWVTEGYEADAKAYVGEPPLLLDDLRGPSREVGWIGSATLQLARPPFKELERGGYVLVLEGQAPAFEADLVFVPPGAAWAGDGVVRALVVSSSEEDASPPPSVWERVPEAPFPPYEEGAAGALPWRRGALEVTEAREGWVHVRVGERSAEVPRFWLARLLYRIALHTMLDDGRRVAARAALGRVETYGGFVYDDSGGAIRLGIRGAPLSSVAPTELASTLEGLYRAVAPPGYLERV